MRLTASEAHTLLQELNDGNWELRHKPTGSIWSVEQAPFALAAVKNLQDPVPVQTPVSKGRDCLANA